MSFRNPLHSTSKPRPLADPLEPRLFLSGVIPIRAASPVPQGPDLTVRLKRLPRGEVVGGTAPQVTVVVANRRPARVRSDPTTVGLYLSSDPLLDDGDRALGTLAISTRLKPGQRIARPLRPTIPADLAPGTYHLLARVDESDPNAEVDETNNLADGGTVAYAAPVVDIVPVALKKVRLYYYKGIAASGVATLWVHNHGNVDFAGALTGTVDFLYGTVSIYASKPRYSQQVTVRRAARKKITLTIYPPLGSFGPFECAVTADAAGDATPGQSVSAPAQIIWR
jgi:hypothetical protein